MLVDCNVIPEEPVYLDRFNPDDGTDLADVYTTLDYLNYGSDPAPLAAALRQISPEKYDVLSAIGLRNDLIFANTLLERGRALRDAPDHAGRHPWLEGVGEIGRQTQTADRVGVNYHSAGFAAGFDGRPEPGLLLGLAGAGLRSNLRWTGDGGSAEIDTVKLGLYAGCFTPDVFINAALVGGHNETAARRNLNFAGHGYDATAGLDTVDLGLNRAAASVQDGESLAAHLAGEARWRPGGWEMSPLARLSYFNLRQNAFDEGGAGDLDLHVNGFRAQLLRTELRLLAGRNFSARTGLQLKPELTLGWAHGVALDDRTLSARFVNPGGEAVEIDGYGDQTDSFLAGAGLSVALAGHLALYGRYDGELGCGFSSQAIKLGLRYGF